MAIVGVSTAAASVHRLVEHAQGKTLPLGIALAATSVGVLAVLAVRKSRIARTIPSHALRADAWLSATGSVLVLVTVAGTALVAAFGWWWIDPVAATAVGLSIALARGGIADGSAETAS